MGTRAPGTAGARRARTRDRAPLPLLAVLALVGASVVSPAPASLETADGEARPRLVVTTGDDVVLVDVPLPDDETWLIEWRHSVAQVTIVDTFAYREGTMLVTGQLTPHLDIAGLGAYAGRGALETRADGTYWLRDIDLPLHGNRHSLIIGTERAPSVLVVGDQRFELSRTNPGAHARVEVLHR